MATETASEEDHLHHLYHHILTLSDNHRGYRYKYHCRASPLLSELASGVKDNGASDTDSSEGASKTADTNDVGIRSIEYACQAFNGGGGPLPDIP